MSRPAYEARLRNLLRVQRPRTYDETRRLELEIALATHRPETYRAMAKRLGCSHVHCWCVARRYRTRQIPLLPRDEQGLVAMRGALDHDPRVASAPAAASTPNQQEQASTDPPAYVVPERFRDVNKWKQEHEAGFPWLRRPPFKRA